MTSENWIKLGHFSSYFGYHWKPSENLLDDLQGQCWNTWTTFDGQDDGAVGGANRRCLGNHYVIDNGLYKWFNIYIHNGLSKWEYKWIIYIYIKWFNI